MEFGNVPATAIKTPCKGQVLLASGSLSVSQKSGDVNEIYIMDLMEFNGILMGFIGLYHGDEWDLM